MGFGQGHNIQVVANKVSELIDRQQQDKVQIMAIIPRSVAVILSLNVPQCDITANEGRQDGHIWGMKATLQSRCDPCEM